MIKKVFVSTVVALLAASCFSSCQEGKNISPRLEETQSSVSNHEVLPITGTWINLAYKDVRNKYTNPVGFDNTDPTLWETKVRELHSMGMEYLVLMEVANEGLSYYPSKIMDCCYDKNKKSPVEAILDEAGKYGMKVFMSTGWAKNQDDNLQNPQIKERQLAIMDELASLYQDKKAFWGWYLPVEDCINPVFPEHAVTAVNALVGRAHRLTPGKKTLISPYGLGLSDFNNPEYEKNLSELKVDIIAYQDEVGCVRESTPLPELRKNWKHLRDIHNRLNIEMWANCETFTWENGTNNRNSALIPASYNRLLAQQAAASDAGVDRIISFMFYGIIEDPSSPFKLGQPSESARLYTQYMSWLNGDEYWNLTEKAFLNKLNNGVDANQIGCTVDKSIEPTKLFDGVLAEEDPTDSRWQLFNKGYHEFVIDLKQDKDIKAVMLRSLNYHLQSIGLTGKVYLSTSNDGQNYQLGSIKEFVSCKNNNHDAWIENLLFDKINTKARFIKLTFYSDQMVYLDELFVNPIY